LNTKKNTKCDGVVLTEKHMYVAFGIKIYTLSIQVPDNARQGINATEQSTL
jgi:translation elongation factor EF-1beta